MLVLLPQYTLVHVAEWRTLMSRRAPPVGSWLGSVLDSAILVPWARSPTSQGCRAASSVHLGRSPAPWEQKPARSAGQALPTPRKDASHARDALQGMCSWGGPRVTLTSMLTSFLVVLLRFPFPPFFVFCREAAIANGSLTCTPCSSGTFQDADGASVCKQCGAG